MRREANYNRDFVLAIMSIVGMAMLGVSASITNSTSRGLFEMLVRYSTLDESEYNSVVIDLYAAVVAGFVGLIVGLVATPFVVLCLRHTRLRKTLPLVYGTAFVVTVLWAYFESSVVGYWSGFSAAAPAFVCVVSMSFLCRWWQSRSLPEHACPVCSYDMRGQRDPGCPECGWGRQTKA